MSKKKTVKKMYLKKITRVLTLLCSVILLTHTQAATETFIEDTYGPEFIAPITTKDFRGAISVERKYVPTKDIAPWYSLYDGAQNTDARMQTYAPIAVRTLAKDLLKMQQTRTRPAVNALLHALQAQNETAPQTTAHTKLIEQRLASKVPPVLTQTGLSGGSAYITEQNTRSVALMPMYKDFLMYGITTNPIDSNYTSNLSGFSAVANMTLDSIMRVGVAFDVGIGHTSFTGDHYSTDNIYDFWGISLFAGYNFNDFGLLFDVGYASEYSDMEQIKSASMLKGTADSEFASTTLTAGMRAEYRIETDILTIAPHMGLRYTSTKFDAYSLHNDAATLSAWTIPLGITFSKHFESYSGWAMVPSFDLGVVATFGDLKATASMPSTANFSNFDMQATDDFAFDGGLGLSLVKDGVSLEVNYNVQLSAQGMGHLVSGSVRFEF